MSKIVVSLSGGMDSTTLLAKALREFDDVFSVGFNYGQRHSRELESARNVALYFHVPFVEVNLESLFKVSKFLGSKSSLLDGTTSVPEGHYTHETMVKTIVPNRNMIFLSALASMALSWGASHIGIAAHNGDHAIYPDCRPQFFNFALDAIRSGNDRWDIGLYTPFIYSSKADIASSGAALGAPYDLTWSCYNGRELHCGKCGTCVERIEAFIDAEVPDPTIYEPGGVEYALRVLGERARG